MDDMGDLHAADAGQSYRHHHQKAGDGKTAKRFVWTADPDRIIASVNEAKQVSGAEQ